MVIKVIDPIEENSVWKKKKIPWKGRKSLEIRSAEGGGDGGGLCTEVPLILAAVLFTDKTQCWARIKP